MPVAADAYDIVLAVHIVAVVVAFGWTFALPVFYFVAARHSPRGLPLLHRIEYTTTRLLLNPALVLVLAAGIFLASDGHHWSEFFVQWGIGAVVVLGAAAGAVLIPLSKRAEQAALRDIAAAGDSEPTPGAEYMAVVRRLNIVGSLMWLMVLATIAIMAIKP
jgi:Predicted integral membrane protein (DUF2269)